MYRPSNLKPFLPACLVIIACISVLFMQGTSEAAISKLGDMRLDSKIASMKKAGVNPVIFPHTFHENIIKCKTCHNSIFKDKRGANDITMKKNMTGQACGSNNCHNSPKAFPLYECAKCPKK